MIFDQILFAGASWNFTKSFSDYPASVWDCTCLFKKDSNSKIELTVTASDDDFIFTAIAEHTGSLTAGTHKYQFKFTHKTSGLVELKTGYEEIEALLENVTDIRTHNRIMLDALQATLEGRATKEVLNMSYKGRAFQLLTLQELRDAIKFYEGEIEREETEEKIKNGEVTGGRLLLGFIK